MIMFIKDMYGWQKVKVTGLSIKKLVTTNFERLNGYTYKQAMEWGL